MAGAAECEPAANDDGPVVARQLQLVHRLHEEARLEPFARSPLGTEADHVGGDVATVHVHARAQRRDEETPGAAGHVERRLPEAVDHALEVGDLGAVGVELRPPAGHEPIVPGLR